jgi:hypothetical protein
MQPEAVSGVPPPPPRKRRLRAILAIGSALFLALLLLVAALVLRRWSAARSAMFASSAADRGGTEAVPGARTGSVFDAPGADGLTSLMRAARAGDVAAIEGLLRSGADPERVDDRGWTPLWHAIHKGSLAAVAALLRAGVDPNRSPNPKLPTLLFAVQSGETEIVRLLLDAGADPRVSTADGLNALLLAVEGGFLADVDRSDRLLGGCNDEMVALVFERAPDLRLPPGLESRFALKIAWFHGCTETLRLLRAHAGGGRVH